MKRIARKKMEAKQMKRLLLLPAQPFTQCGRKWAFRLLIMLLLAASGAWVTLDLLASAKLRREIAVYRELGLPLRPAEIDRPAIDPENNAAFVYERAFKLLEARHVATKVQDLRRDLRVVRLNAWDETSIEVPRIIGDPDFRTALDYGEQAASMLEFSIDPQQIDADALLTLHYLQWIAAVQAEEDGNFEEAARHVDATLRMAAHLGQLDHSLLGLLVIRAIHSQAVAVLQERLSLKDIETRHLREWVVLLEEEPGEDPIREAFQFNATLWWPQFHPLISRPFTDPTEDNELADAFWLTRGGLRRFLARPLLKADFAVVLRLHRTMAELASPPYAVTTEVFHPGASLKIPWYARNAKVLSSRGGKVIFNINRQQAPALVGRAAMAVELYRRDQGHPPGSLNDLIPHYLSEIPHDAISGKAVNYEKFDLGYRIFTITPDAPSPDAVDTHQSGATVESRTHEFVVTLKE